ncbi:protease HtpX [Sinimarinibacterium thermocellulolyticum]|jgi:heat shock protein HtpX|uniref:Protease HtpX n=1 Tax=Sinimarinibacterium thermocellulolyticum TaxID=3170016 RepID=A0ABV2A918_9GAMM
MKRTLLFLGTNLAIVLVLSIALNALGVPGHLTASGLNLESLLIFAAVIGMGGSLLSLALSKWMAKRAVGAVVITHPQTRSERWLVQTVQRQARAAGIDAPEVAVYDSPQVNAFATGMNRNQALVAVSTGLLQQMTAEEAEAVLGHEVAHVANGDMVTLALIQGVINTFVIVLARVVGQFVDRVIFRTESGQGPAFWLTMIAAELVLGALASLIVLWFSRQREFRADRGGAELAGRQNMIAALRRLAAVSQQPLPRGLAAFGIAGGAGAGIRRLFMSHPPLEERIAALQVTGPMPELCRENRE